MSVRFLFHTGIRAVTVSSITMLLRGASSVRVLRANSTMGSMPPIGFLNRETTTPPVTARALDDGPK